MTKYLFARTPLLNHMHAEMAVAQTKRKKPKCWTGQNTLAGSMVRLLSCGLGDHQNTVMAWKGSKSCYKHYYIPTSLLIVVMFVLDKTLMT